METSTGCGFFVGAAAFLATLAFAPLSLLFEEVPKTPKMATTPAATAAASLGSLEMLPKTALASARCKLLSLKKDESKSAACKLLLLDFVYVVEGRKKGRKKIVRRAEQNTRTGFSTKNGR